MVTASTGMYTLSLHDALPILSVEDGGRLRLNGGTVSFATNVTVNTGAGWDIDSSTTVVRTEAHTNRGQTQRVSRNNLLHVKDSGPVQNLGLWEVFADPNCSGC